MAPKRTSSPSSSSISPSVQVIIRPRTTSSSSTMSNGSFASRLQRTSISSISQSSSASSSSSNSAVKEHNQNQNPRSKSKGKRKGSDRAQLSIEDGTFESSIQSAFSNDSISSTLSIRQISISQIHKRDREDFKFPSLTSICLEIVAKEFGSWILPSRETFDQVGAVEDNGKGKAKKKVIPKKVVKKRKTRAFGSANWISKDSEGEDDDEEFQPPLDGFTSTTATSLPSRSSTRNSPSNSISKPTFSVSVSRTIPTSETLQLLSLRNHHLLKHLPSNHLSTLLTLLILHSPQALTRKILINYFLSSPQVNKIHLSSSLLSLSSEPNSISLLLASVNSLRNVKRLELQGLTRLEDRALISLFKRNQTAEMALEKLSLPGCLLISDTFLKFLSSNPLSESLGRLNHLDLSFTDITPSSLESIMNEFKGLRVLKVANVRKLVSISYTFSSPLLSTILTVFLQLFSERSNHSALNQFVNDSSSLSLNSFNSTSTSRETEFKIY